MVPNLDLNVGDVPTETYDGSPLMLEQDGALKIHIRQDEGMLFRIPYTCCDYVVRAYFSDLTLSETVVTLTATYDSATNEYIFDVPAFDCFMMVVIDIIQG